MSPLAHGDWDQMEPPSTHCLNFDLPSWQRFLSGKSFSMYEVVRVSSDFA